MIAVIVPAHRADPAFDRCLASLAVAAAGMPVFVVDDGSPGGEVSRAARERGFEVLRLERSLGPAAARNRGAALAQTEVVLFIDADIVVQPDTAARVDAFFASHPDVAAVFGSYDSSPDAPQLVSQYKNLTHHYVHQQGREDAFTFWAGCGAVRRDLFLALGGFDERYGRPCIEDIELGYRLRSSGARAVLLKDLQVTHLKRWTLRGLVATDVFDRGVPWVQLILAHPEITTGDLNLSWRARASLVLTWAALAALVCALWQPLLLAISGLAIASVLVIDRGYFMWLARMRGIGFAARCVPLHLLYQLYAGLSAVLGLAAYLSGGTAQSSPQRLTRSVGSSFAVLSGGEVAARVIGFLTTLYLARAAGVNGFGQLEVGLAVLSYLQLMVDGGLDIVAIRTVARDPRSRPLFAANLIGLRLALAAILLAVVFAVTAAGRGPSEMKTVVLRYAFAVVPLALSVNWVFQTDHYMWATAARNVVVQLAYAALVMLLVARPADVALVPIAYVAATTVGIALLFVWYWRRFGAPGIALDLTFIGALLPQAWPIALSGTLRTVSYNFDLLILGYLYPSLGVGLYAAAYRVLTMPLLGYATLNTAAFPTLARLQGRDRLRAAALNGVLVVVTSLAITLALRYWAEPIMVLAAGSPYAPAAGTLALLALSIPLTSAAGVFRQLLLASHRQGSDLLAVLGGGGVNVALNLFLIPRAGLRGAAIATIAGEAVVLALAAAMVARAGMGPRRA